MYNRPLIILVIAFCAVAAATTQEQPAPETPPLSLKDKFNIAKIIFSNGTAGVTDLAKDKATHLATQAKEAIAASVEQAHITVERAKAEYAQQQTQQAQEQIEALKKQIATLQEEIDRLKLQLRNAQQVATQAYNHKK